MDDLRTIVVGGGKRGRALAKGFEKSDDCKVVYVVNVNEAPVAIVR